MTSPELIVSLEEALQNACQHLLEASRLLRLEAGQTEAEIAAAQQQSSPLRLTLVHNDDEMTTDG